MIDNSVEIVLVTSQPEDYQDLLQETQHLLDFSPIFHSVVTWSQLELLDLELLNNIPDNTTKSLPLIYLVDQAICQNQAPEQLQQFSDQADPHPVIFITNTPENILDFSPLTITDTFTKEELTPQSLAHCLRLTVNMMRQFQQKLDKVEHQLKASIDQLDHRNFIKQNCLSDKDLEQIYNNLNTAGSMADETGHILRANQKFCELVGYSEQELMNISWPQITYLPDLVLQKIYNQNIIAGVISSYTMKKRYVHKNSYLVRANLQVSLYHRADGQKIFMMKILDEVAEYPHTNTKLIDPPPAVNNTFTHNLPDLVTRFDKEFRYIYVSDVITDITGLPPEAFIGKTNQDLGLIDDVVKFWDDCLTSIFTSGKPQMIEFTFDTPHLGKRNFEGHLFPEFDANYQVNTAICITHDVTYYKSALVQLQKNQVLLDRIANNSPYIIYLYNLEENTHFYINQKITNILGYDMETVRNLGREFFLQNIHPDDQQAFLDIPHRFKKNLTNQVLEYDYRLRHANGTWRWLRSYDVVFQRDTAGNIQQILCSTTDITYHKLIENQLWESESRLHVIIANTSDSILIVDKVGKIKFANSAASSLFNLPLDELLDSDFGMPILVGQTAEVNIMQSKNKLALGEMSIAVTEWQGEEVYIVSLRDITERRQAEEALRDSEERFRQLADNIQDVFWLFSSEEQELLYISPAYEKIWGRSLDQLTKGKNSWQNWLKYVYPIDRELLMSAYRQQRQGIPTHREYRIIRPDGTIRWIYDRAFVINNERGEIERIAGIAEDITERKKIELELNHYRSHLEELVNQRTALLQQEIKERQKAEDAIRFQARLLDVVENAVVAFDNDGKIIYWNRFATKMYGWTAEEAIGQNAIFLLAAESVKKEAKAAFSQFPNGVTWSGEFLVQDRHGRTFPVITTDSPIYNENGESMGTVAISFDITEQKQVMLAMEKANAELGITVEAQNQNLAEAIGKLQTEIIKRKDQEQKLRIITDSLPVCISYVDKTLHYQFVNKTYETWFGLKKEEMLGKFIRDIIGEIAYQNVLDHLDKIFQGEKISYEKLVPYLHGESRYVIANLVPDVNPEDQQVRGYYAMITDISDRKRTEEALKDSEQLFRAIFEQAAVGIAQSNLSGELVKVNQGLCDMLGYKQEYLLKKTYRQFTHPDDLVRQEKYIQQIINGKISSYSMEKRYLCENGQIKWVNLTGSGVRNGEGETLYLISVVVDIQELKQVESILRQQIQQERILSQIAQHIRQSLKIDEILNTTVQEIRYILQSDRVFILQFQPNNTMQITHESVVPQWSCGIGTVFMNEEFSHFYNTDQSYRYSQPIVIKDATVENIPNGLEKYLALAKVKSSIFMPIWQRDQIWGLLTVDFCDQLHPWEKWEINLLKRLATQVGIAIQQAQLYTQLRKELHDRRKVQSELEKAKELADTANQAKSLFLANMSHELRTPLNAILGFSQLLQRQDNLTTKQGEHLQIISRAGEHLLTLINDILDLSKIEAGQISLAENYFNLWQMLSSLQEMLQLKASSKELPLHFTIDANLPQYVRADEGKLRQVLINLLSNAVKFTMKGEVSLDVKLSQPVNISKPSPGDEKRQMTFTISDTGPGISQEELDGLFDPFVQTETGRRSQQGSGLGLAISRHFARLMGGEISVHSQVNHGSIFTFSLPIEILNRQIPIPDISQREVISLAPNQAQYRILVVDDDWTARKLLINILEPLGFLVQEATNGQEAVNLWQSWQPHLILMDMRMPVMGGYQAVRIIRNSLAGQETTIIALTAHSFASERNTILEGGCDDFITKPFLTSVLLEKIAHFLGVEYIYTEVSSQENSQYSLSQKFNKPELLPEDFTLMPENWWYKLQQAALSARERRLGELLTEIPPTASQLKDKLEWYINHLYFEQIVNFTRSSNHN